MTPSGETALSEACPAVADTRLQTNTISPIGLAALAIGITSPAMGLFALWGTMESATGPVTPLIFLSAMLVTLPTGICTLCLIVASLPRVPHQHGCGAP